VLGKEKKKPLPYGKTIIKIERPGLSINHEGGKVRWGQKKGKKEITAEKREALPSGGEKNLPQKRCFS